MSESTWSDDEALSRELDLLVDGELSDADRALLLLRLDDTPDGWRRCAAAFLEQQCWRETARAVTAPAASPQSIVSKPATVIATGAARTRGLSWFTVAASTLAAFGLGLAMRGALRDAPANRPAGHQHLAVAEPAQASPQIASADPAVPATADEATGEIWLPAANHNEVSATEVSAVLPGDLVKQLEASGHELEQRQEWWPVELKDGRRAILPIDRLDVRYVGASYQ